MSHYQKAEALTESRSWEIEFLEINWNLEKVSGLQQIVV